MDSGIWLGSMFKYLVHVQSVLSSQGHLDSVGVIIKEISEKSLCVCCTWNRQYSMRSKGLKGAACENTQPEQFKISSFILHSRFSVTVVIKGEIEQIRSDWKLGKAWNLKSHGYTDHKFKWSSQRLVSDSCAWKLNWGCAEARLKRCRQTSLALSLYCPSTRISPTTASSAGTPAAGLARAFILSCVLVRSSRTFFNSSFFIQSLSYTFPAMFTTEGDVSISNQPFTATSITIGIPNRMRAYSASLGLLSRPSIWLGQFWPSRWPSRSSSSTSYSWASTRSLQCSRTTFSGGPPPKSRSTANFSWWVEADFRATRVLTSLLISTGFGGWHSFWSYLLKPDREEEWNRHLRRQRQGTWRALCQGPQR